MSTVRYTVTYMAQDGLRTITHSAQGRLMKVHRAEADLALVALLSNNTEERLVSVFGPQSIGTFRVDAFDCYDHGDPKGIYVNRYRVKFSGKTRGAIGVSQTFDVETEASGKDAAVISLYEKYDHISSPVVTEVPYDYSEVKP